MKNLFTPFANSFETDVDADGRFHMRLSDADFARIPDRGPFGPIAVTDLNTHKRYMIRGAPCESSCYCAAEIVGVINSAEWN